MKKLFMGILPILILAACKKDDSPSSKMLTLNITGLSDLGPDFRYEGWIIVNGNPVSTGTFSVDGSGNLSATSFSVDKDQMSNATDFVLTIEPFPDADPAPSSTHILAGSFSGSSASVSVADTKALGDNFNAAAGTYILATPTDGASSNEKSGLWFLDLSGAMPAAGLTLPVLPNGWEYEGWAVIGGVPVTTGKFTDPAIADEGAPFSGAMAGPPFPGEDFLMNAPAGMTFPTDLSGGKAVITIEPSPDNSAAPFGSLKPLVADIPAAATDHTNYDLTNNAAGFPSGTVTR
jgi:Anti-sigma-K factor rskA, C-terminal